jgi:hypothetical protein
MGGSASRPRNDFRKTEKYGSSVFIQLRSNLLYQKRLRKGSAAHLRGASIIILPAAPRRLTAAHKTEKFSLPLGNGVGGAKIKKRENFSALLLLLA